MKNKKDYRFNIIDFLIIVLAVAIIFVTTLAVLGNDMVEYVSKKNDVSYSLSITDKVSVDNLAHDSEVYTSDGKIAGTIVSTSMESGKLQVVINATAYEVGDTLFIKGQKLEQNESFTLTLADGTEIDTVCAWVLITD